MLGSFALEGVAVSTFCLDGEEVSTFDFFADAYLTDLFGVNFLELAVDLRIEDIEGFDTLAYILASSFFGIDFIGLTAVFGLKAAFDGLFFGTAKLGIAFSTLIT